MTTEITLDVEVQVTHYTPGDAGNRWGDHPAPPSPPEIEIRVLLVDDECRHDITDLIPVDVYENLCADALADMESAA